MKMDLKSHWKLQPSHMFFAPWSLVPLSSGPTFACAVNGLKNDNVISLCPPQKFELQLSFLTLPLWTQALCLYPSWVSHPNSTSSQASKEACIFEFIPAVFIHAGLLQGLLFLLNIDCPLCVFQLCYTFRSQSFLQPCFPLGKSFMGSCQEDSLKKSKIWCSRV